MGRKTPRVKGRNKGKRWAKGQSSSSNPETRKHRNLARKFSSLGIEETYGRKEPDVEGLNLDLLSLNDGEKPFRKRVESFGDDESVATSFGNRSRFTAATFASDWSQTSNVTFSRFLEDFQARSTHHRDMLALLEAVTEIIRSKGGQESDTEYFCTLLSSLETIDDETTLAAVMPFVVMCIKKLNPDFLRAKFTEFSKILYKVLKEKSTSGSTAILRGAIVSLGFMLKHQHMSAWDDPRTVELFNSILAFTIHTKPKIRKAAQGIVSSVLNECASKLNKPGVGAGPAGNAAGKLVKAHLEEANKDPKNTLTTTLHILEMCRRIMRCIPSGPSKSICEMIVQLMSLKNMVLKQLCLNVFKEFMEDSELTLPLSPKTSGQLLAALWNEKPAMTDSILLPLWLTTMKHGILAIHKIDEDLALKHLQAFLPCISACWTTDSKPITIAASCAMSGLIKRAVQPSIKKLVSERELRGESESVLSVLETALLDGLKFQAHQSWPLVFQIWSQFFESCGKDCLDLAQKGIHHLGEMRTSFDEETAAAPKMSGGTKKALGLALGKAIQVIGPRRFLSAYPLQITGNEPFGRGLSRSWILPLMRDNLSSGCEAELEFFRAYFLPLTDVFHARSIGAIPNSPDSDKKVYGYLEIQVWWLLPGFCACATDLSSSFPRIAKALGNFLKTRPPQVVKEVASGLRNCAESAARRGGSDKESVAAFSKNFLPLLVVKYLEPDAAVDVRACTMNAITAFLAIAPPNVVWSLSEKALSEMDAEDDGSKDATGNTKKELIYDLCVALAPHLPETDGGKANLTKMFDNALEICAAVTAGHKLQKKAYRLLEAICRGESKLERQLVTARRGDLVQAIVSSLSKSSPAAKVARLKCLVRLLEMEPIEGDASGVLSAADDEFVESAIGEALLCVRDSKEAARTAAFSVLVKAAAFFKARLQCDDEETVKHLLKYLLAGLGGNPHMVSCSLVALGHICYTMKECFPIENMGPIVENASLLLTTASREIVGSGLSLFKVLVKIYPPEVMTPYLKTILSGLQNMTEDCKRHTRLESKKLYRKLMVKFGQKTVAGLSGAKDDPVLEKRLKNIRKELAREKRKRNSLDEDGADAASDAGDVDSDEDVEVGSKSKSKSRSRLSVASGKSSIKGIDRSRSIAEILAEVSSDEGAPDDMDVDGKRGGLKKRSKSKQGMAWIREKADEDIVDLLDPSASGKILAADPTSKNFQSKKRTKEEFATASDGRLIIEDSESDEDEFAARGKKRKRAASTSVLDGIEEKFKSNKSLRNEDDGVDWLRDFDDDKQSQVSGSTLGIHRKNKKAKKSGPQPLLGTQYRSKTGKGDVKKKGMPDPYAYFPLVRDVLNKRKAAKHKAKFKSVIGGARAGAVKGSKMKAKSRKGKRAAV